VSKLEVVHVHKYEWMGGVSMVVRWWSDGWSQNWNYIARAWVPSQRPGNWSGSIDGGQIASLAGRVKELEAERVQYRHALGCYECVESPAMPTDAELCAMLAEEMGGEITWHKTPTASHFTVKHGKEPFFKNSFDPLYDWRDLGRAWEYYLSDESTEATEELSSCHFMYEGDRISTGIGRAFVLDYLKARGRL
jgi:hypothetical protein